MKKRALALLLVMVLAVGMMPYAAASASLDNFAIQSGGELPFRDIDESHWSYANVWCTYKLGLMKGTPNGTFMPSSGITDVEAITIAARIHSIYATGIDSFEQPKGSPWWAAYLTYAHKNGVLDGYSAPIGEKPITREGFALLLSHALPRVALPTVRTSDPVFVDDSSIAEKEAIDLLYRAGIMAGRMENGDPYFRPNDLLDRASAATVISRLAIPALRLSDGASQSAEELVTQWKEQLPPDTSEQPAPQQPAPPSQDKNTEWVALYRDFLNSGSSADERGYLCIGQNVMDAMPGAAMSGLYRVMGLQLVDFNEDAVPELILYASGAGAASYVAGIFAAENGSVLKVLETSCNEDAVRVITDPTSQAKHTILVSGQGWDGFFTLDYDVFETDDQVQSYLGKKEYYGEGIDDHTDYTYWGNKISESEYENLIAQIDSSATVITEHSAFAPEDLQYAYPTPARFLFEYDNLAENY